MLKIVQARFQQYVNQELQDVQAEFRKGRGTRDQIDNFCWITEKKQENSPQKTCISASLIMREPLCGSQQTVKNSSRDGNTRLS